MTSDELWVCIFILCTKGDLGFITLSQREIWAGAAAAGGHFNLPEEATNCARQHILN